MENKLLTLAHLETLSTADLLTLADDFGIDIPDDLNRRFIISELVEVAEEFTKSLYNASTMKDDDQLPETDLELPSSFNETEISVILRNPAWAFVYWDISAEALRKISESEKFRSLVLRVSYFESEEDINPIEYYDLQITLKDREQYILLESGKKVFRVDLVAFFADGSSDSLTLSPKITLPKTPEILSKAFPGQDIEVPKILEVSGMKKLLKLHYEKYRQSFVE